MAARPAWPPSPSHAVMIAVLGKLPGPAGDGLRDLIGRVDALEIRADLIGDLDAGWLRQRFPGTLVYTLRSRAQGGRFAGDRAERQRRLASAARSYDVVDLEWDGDVTPQVLAAVPPDKRRISHHAGATADLAALTVLTGRMTATPAALYALSIDAATAEAGAASVSLLAAMQRPDLTAFATGDAGLWTRIVAPRLGAPIVSCQIDADDPVGLPTLERLQVDYGFPALDPTYSLYGIVGRALTRSASPRLHNRTYRMLGLPAIYLPFVTEDIERLWHTLLPALDDANLPLRGLTIISPFKERLLDLVDHANPAAAHCGAANVAWREASTWRAETTDTAVVSALTALGVDPRGQRTAVVGCGAAGRSVAAALALAGAEVFLVNRGQARGRFAAERLGLPFVPLTEFSPVGFTLVVHATPVIDRVPISLAGLSRGATVLELVYSGTPTPLAAEAAARGLFVVDGWEVLAAEVALQFQVMTGLTMPPSLAMDRPFSTPGAARRAWQTSRSR
jgi:3-dehydroquinate dehydratase/shikimate dehydrogenase